MMRVAFLGSMSKNMIITTTFGPPPPKPASELSPAVIIIKTTPIRCVIPKVADDYAAPRLFVISRSSHQNWFILLIYILVLLMQYEQKKCFYKLLSEKNKKAQQVSRDIFFVKHFCLLQTYKLTDNKTNLLYQMSRKLTSPPSIEQALENSSKDQYIANLKVQCRMREEALRTAESLIEAYQNQNESLRQEIKNMKFALQLKEQKLMIFQSDEQTIKNLERKILKYSEKVNDLLQKNLEADKKIKVLQKQLCIHRQQHKNQRQMIRQRVSQHKRNQKHRKQLESHFHNFLKLPERDSSFEYSPIDHRQSPGKQSLITAVTKNDVKKVDSNIKVLQWKLRQKDEEVTILLKRIKDLQQRIHKGEVLGRKHKNLTQDSLQNLSSQKGYISEFTQ